MRCKCLHCQCKPHYKQWKRPNVSLQDVALDPIDFLHLCKHCPLCKQGLSDQIHTGKLYINLTRRELNHYAADNKKC